LQARLADVAVYLHAWACTLSKLNMQLGNGSATEREKAAAIHFIDLAEHEIGHAFRELQTTPTTRCSPAASATLTWAQTLPDSDYNRPGKVTRDQRSQGPKAKAGVDQAVSRR